MIDFHGGSFILGSPSEQAPFCAFMAKTLGNDHGCVVLSVDYRLGPYAKFPAANVDAEEVIKAVLDEDTPAGRVLREDIRRRVQAMGSDVWVDLDPTRVAVSGFSSGGNIALTCAMSSKNDPTLGDGRDWPSVIPESHRYPIPVILFYPSLDSRLLPDERPRPPGLDPPTGWFTRWKIESELMPKYMPVERRADPRASPGLAEIKNGGLHAGARILLVLPELDSLNGQSKEWVAKMKAEGRGHDLEVIDVLGEMHGWTQFPDQWLKSEESRKKKYDCFERASQFVEHCWWGQERMAGTRFGQIGERRRS
jgi:acetyl esterase/lipase